MEIRTDRWFLIGDNEPTILTYSKLSNPEKWEVDFDTKDAIFKYHYKINTKGERDG